MYKINSKGQNVGQYNNLNSAINKIREFLNDGRLLDCLEIDGTYSWSVIYFDGRRETGFTVSWEN